MQASDTVNSVDPDISVKLGGVVSLVCTIYHECSGYSR